MTKKSIKLKKIGLLFLFFAHHCLAQQAVDDESQQIQAKEIKAELLFSEGMKWYLLEDFEKASGEFKKNLSTYGDSPATYFMLAKTEVAQNKTEEALYNAKKASELEPSNLFYLHQLAAIETKVMSYKNAIASYKKILKLNPNSVEAYRQLYSVHRLAENDKEALATLDDIEKLIGPNDELTEKKQEILIGQNKLKKALKVGKKQSEDDPEYNLKQAVILAQDNKTNEAIELLQGCIEANPSMTKAYMVLGDLLAHQKRIPELETMLKVVMPTTLPFALKIGLFGNLFSFYKNDRNTGLEASLDELIRIHPDEARPYLYKGDLLIKINKLNEGKEAYLNAVKKDPSIFEAWLAVIELDLRYGSFKEMQKHTEKALEIFPNHAYFWYNQGFAQMNLKEHEDALVSFEEALRLSTNNTELAHNIEANMSNIMIELKRTKEGELLFEKILRENPIHEQSLNDYALYLTTRLKNPLAAKKYAEKLISAYPKNAGNFHTIAVVELESGNLSKAGEYIDRAIAMELNPAFFETKGDIAFKKNDFVEAKAQWTKAKNAGLNSPQLDQKLQK